MTSGRCAAAGAVLPRRAGDSLIHAHRNDIGCTTIHLSKKLCIGRRRSSARQRPGTHAERQVAEARGELRQRSAAVRPQVVLQFQPTERAQLRQRRPQDAQPLGECDHLSGPSAGVGAEEQTMSVTPARRAGVFHCAYRCLASLRCDPDHVALQSLQDVGAETTSVVRHQFLYSHPLCGRMRGTPMHGSKGSAQASCETPHTYDKSHLAQSQIQSDQVCAAREVERRLRVVLDGQRAQRRALSQRLSERCHRNIHNSKGAELPARWTGHSQLEALADPGPAVSAHRTLWVQHCSEVKAGSGSMSMSLSACGVVCIRIGTLRSSLPCSVMNLMGNKSANLLTVRALPAACCS